MIGPPVCADLLGDVRERQRLVVRGRVGADGLAVAPLDRVDLAAPRSCAARARRSLDHLLRRLDHRHAGGEGDAAAAGQIAVADRCRCRRPSARTRSIGHAQLLGRHHRHRGARAADVGDCRSTTDGAAVVVDVTAAVDCAADVEPEAGADAASLVRAERRLVVRMVLARPPAFDEADVRRTSGRRTPCVAVLHRVLQRAARSDPCPACAASSSIALSTAKAAIGAPGRAVGRDLRPC